MMLVKGLEWVRGREKRYSYYVLYKAYAKTDQFKFQLAVSRAQHINVQLQNFNMTPDMILDT